MLFAVPTRSVDMLNKIIEDRHVEDDLSMQASLRLSDGLRVVSAVHNQSSAMPESASAPVLRNLKSSMGPLSQLLGDSAPPAGPAKGEQREGKEGEGEGEAKKWKGAGDTEKVLKVAFDLVRVLVQ